MSLQTLQLCYSRKEMKTQVKISKRTQKMRSDFDKHHSGSSSIKVGDLGLCILAPISSKGVATLSKQDGSSLTSKSGKSQSKPVTVMLDLKSSSTYETFHLVRDKRDRQIGAIVNK